MASRESQGLQISLILFVMVSVVLAVMTFVFYRSSESAKRTATAAQEQQAQVAERSLTDSFKIQYLQHVIGAVPLSEAELASVMPAVSGDATMAAIDEAYTTDMATFGEGLPVEKRTYRDLPVYMMMALKNKNEANSQLAKEIQQLNLEKAELLATEQKRTAAAQLGQQQANDDRDQQSQAYQQSLGEVQKMREDEEQAKQLEMNKLKKDIADRETLLGKKDEQLGQSQLTVEQQKKRILELVDQPFEVPDGKILWVNQQTGLVWINLGKADGLHRQTTFSVFGADAMNIATRSEEDGEEGGLSRQADNAKAKIEITTVLQDHLAEGRIVDDTPADPIMPGDQIFSPAWKPGRRVRFALAGVLDLDGDKKSDLKLLQSIILMGGGAIDVEPTPSTGYLVLGDMPLDRAGAAAYGKLRGDATTLGIQFISLPILLDLIGYKAEVSTMELGRRRDARGRPVAEEFRQRQPPASAF